MTPPHDVKLCLALTSAYTQFVLTIYVGYDILTINGDMRMQTHITRPAPYPRRLRYSRPASLRQAIYGIYTLSLVESSIILGDHNFKILLLRMCSRVSWKVFLQEIAINYEWMKNIAIETICKGNVL